MSTFKRISGAWSTIRKYTRTHDRSRSVRVNRARNHAYLVVIARFPSAQGTNSTSTLFPLNRLTSFGAEIPWT